MKPSRMPSAFGMMLAPTRLSGVSASNGRVGLSADSPRRRGRDDLVIVCARESRYFKGAAAIAWAISVSQMTTVW
jgi:hypothetical protein